MLETWRWFGPDDPVTCSHVMQAGAEGIVTAIHTAAPGVVWRPCDIVARKAEIEEAGLDWIVVESIPVHPSIKLGDSLATHYTDAWIETMRNLSDQGLKIICYNFMPVVDWTRTDLRYRTARGGLALRFDPAEFAAYDLFVLRREGATKNYDTTTLKRAEAYYKSMDEAEILRLEETIIAGLPGSAISHGREEVKMAIAEYEGLTAEALRANLITFLDKVIPAAEDCGARICLHPDDPPFSIFGLPRVVSTASDYAALFNAIPSLANGITLCAGSLASRPDNDVLAIAMNFADRIHFAHLRNVTLMSDGGFFEDEHLEGRVDMVALIKILMDEEFRRRAEGRVDSVIPMRPDHGHVLLDDINKKTNPGYSSIGRLKGLAEIRGIGRALSTMFTT